jgi:hypothetical protein
MVNSGLRQRLSPVSDLGQENSAAQILAGHVEKRLGRLDHRNVDTSAHSSAVERTGKVRGDFGKA